ncbi:Uncharacterized protein dnm_051200 [Desulfonema magnum]|uniref:Uncharacterized protein n=1 Tax=Desulfonema magnum TaxID=45655 RepID=A0A975BPJ3_9BACT|nr:Uncharacterized protein dnm_051200 [Desulfonema magnum]
MQGIMNYHLNIIRNYDLSGKFGTFCFQAVSVKSEGEMPEPDRLNPESRNFSIC